MPVLKQFDPETASHDYFKARHTYQNLRQQEEMPEDPPRSLEFSINDARAWKLLEKEKLEVWHLWENDNIIAELFANIGFYEDNQHLMWCNLGILKPYRHNGYTRPLLEKIAELATLYERKLLMFNTSSRVPAGAAFAERLGATRGIESHTNQLVLSEVDKQLLETWSNNTSKHFTLGLWGDTYPEEEIEAIASLINVLNTAPKDNLDIEDQQIKPEDIRAGEASGKSLGIERWMLYVRHTSGELAGFTETFWIPENPENLYQGGTGVLPKYRGHGLGKWLKAAMIQKVLSERPIAKRIRTGNADSNASMLAINNALGFKPYIAETIWQIEIAKIKDYLVSKT